MKNLIDAFARRRNGPSDDARRDFSHLIPWFIGYEKRCRSLIPGNARSEISRGSRCDVAAAPCMKHVVHKTRSAAIVPSAIWPVTLQKYYDGLPTPNFWRPMPAPRTMCCNPRLKNFNQSLTPRVCLDLMSLPPSYNGRRRFSSDMPTTSHSKRSVLPRSHSNGSLPRRRGRRKQPL